MPHSRTDDNSPMTLNEIRTFTLDFKKYPNCQLKDSEKNTYTITKSKFDVIDKYRKHTEYWFEAAFVPGIRLAIVKSRLDELHWVSTEKQARWCGLARKLTFLAMIDVDVGRDGGYDVEKDREECFKQRPDLAKFSQRCKMLYHIVNVAVPLIAAKGYLNAATDAQFDRIITFLECGENSPFLDIPTEQNGYAVSVKALSNRMISDAAAKCVKKEFGDLWFLCKCATDGCA